MSPNLSSEAALRAFRDGKPRSKRPEVPPAIGFVFLIVLASTIPRQSLLRGMVVVGLASSLFFLAGRLGSLRGAFGAAQFAPIGQGYGTKDGVAALLVRVPKRSAHRFGETSLRQKRSFAYLSWETLSRHILVVGNSGSGKTTGVFNHLMLSSQLPWIYQDQKGELPLRKTFPDRPVWGLDTRGYESRSRVWNPLQEIRSEEDLELLTTLLVPDRGDQYDWVIRSARFLLEALMKGEGFRSLQQVGRFLENEGAAAISDRIPKGARSVLDNPRQRGYFLEALREALHPFMSPRVSRVTEGESTVSLSDFIEEGGYVLANEDPQLRASVTLFWALLLNRLRNRPPGAQRLMLLLDEFGDAGRIPNMASALALYRSKNVAIVAGIQTYSLLKSVYSEEWEAVRDGFGTVFLLTANLPTHLHESLSRELGQVTRRPITLNWGISGPSVTLGSPMGASLVPPERWGEWGENRVLLAKSQTPTWWIPCPVSLEPFPLGARESQVRLPETRLPTGSRHLDRSALR